MENHSQDQHYRAPGISRMRRHLVEERLRLYGWQPSPQRTNLDELRKALYEARERRGTGPEELFDAQTTAAANAAVAAAATPSTATPPTASESAGPSGGRPRPTRRTSPRTVTPPISDYQDSVSDLSTDSEIGMDAEVFEEEPPAGAQGLSDEAWEFMRRTVKKEMRGKRTPPPPSHYDISSARVSARSSGGRRA